MPIRDIRFRPPGRALVPGLALLLLALGAAREARAQQADPVAELDQALKDWYPPTEPPEALKEAVKERKARLTELTDPKHLRDLGQIYQALLLQSWRDEAPPPSESSLLSEPVEATTLHREVREAVLKRFIAQAKQDIRLGNEENSPALRAAVATLVGELGANARSGYRRGVATRRAGNQLLIAGLSGLVEPMAGLAKSDSSPVVRMAAARALAKLRSDPQATLDALQAQLKDPSPQVRRAAALALSGLLRGSPTAESGALATQIAEPTMRDIAQFGPPVARAAGAVLAGRDDDEQVRRLSAAALLQVADDLKEQLRTSEVPDEDRRTLRPVANALWDQTATLGRAAADPDPQVRQTALRVIEQLGDIRTYWLHPEMLVPPRLITPERGTPPSAPPRKTTSADELRDITLVYAAEQAPAAKGEPPPLGQAVPELVNALNDPDPRNRRAAVDGLESITARAPEQTVAQLLGPEPAAAAAKGLERALSDRDRFVRWAAARTLGKMAPLSGVEDGKRVQAGAIAGLARLLSDPDPDVRIRAARAVERFGPSAQDAMPALARSATRGDIAPRLAALQAILAVGGNPGAAVPALAEELRSDSVLLRQAAAQALAKYGTEAAPARAALERALADTDPEVRRLAADALVKIGTGK